MAFNRKNLTPIGNNAKRGSIPCLYSFWNEDGDTVTASGYMTNCFELQVGDQILVIDDDYGNNAWYNVSAVSSGAATLVLNA